MMKSTVLLCASNPGQFYDLMPSLKLDANLIEADSVHHALNLISANLAAVIIDMELTGGSGLDVAKAIRDGKNGKTVPIMLICKPGSKAAAKAVSDDLADTYIETGFTPGFFLNKYFQLRERSDELKWAELNKLQTNMLKVSKSAFSKMVSAYRGDAPPEEAKRIIEDCSKAVTGLVNTPDISVALDALKGHHNYSFVHSLKVSAFMTIFGSHIDIKDKELEVLAQAGLIHDIGKMLTPPDILDKPSQLDEDEWEIMRKHPADGAEFLRQMYVNTPEIARVSEAHHERIDGTGYPHGLKGGQIDEISLIGAIADVYSALTDKRSYKPSMPAARALAIMEQMAGTHLEPKLVKRFSEIVRDETTELADNP